MAVYTWAVTGPDLRQMRYFVKVAELGSFTEAAAALGLAQQAVSQQVKVLEAQLGVTLLDRGARAVTPTAAGELFLREARDLVAAADRLVAETRDAAAGQDGAVRLGFVQSTSFDTVPALVAAAAEKFPELEVVATEVLGGNLTRLLTSEGFDLVIVSREPLAEGLESQRLRQERFLAAVPEGHRLAGSRSIDLVELRDESFQVWHREMAPGCHDAVVAACRSAGFEPRVNALTAGAVAWTVITSGRGVALVPESQRPHIPRGIQLLPLRTPRDAVLHIDTVWMPQRITPVTERIVAFAAEFAGARGWLRDAR